MSVSLGAINDDNDAGGIYLDTTSASPKLSNLSSLNIVIAAGVTFQKDSFGIPESIVTPLVNVAFQQQSTYLYTITFSHIGQTTPYETITVQNPDTSGATYNQLKITVASDGGTKIYNCTNNTSATDSWEIATTEADSTVDRDESIATTWNSDNTIKTVLQNIYDSQHHLTSSKQTVSQVFSWGTEEISEALDPSGANLLTTWSYYTTAGTGAAVGQLEQVTYPSGNWEQYTYDTSGRLYQKVTQYKNNAAPATPCSTASDNRCETYTYSSDGTTTTVVTTLAGSEVGRTYSVTTHDSLGNSVAQEIVCTVPGAAQGDSSNLVTTTIREPSGLYRTLSVKNPNGTMTFYNYTGTTTTVSTGAPNSTGTAIVDGTQTVTTTDGFGHQASQTVTDIASGLTISSATTTEIDSYGRPTTITYNDGTTEHTVYGCCGVDSQTGRDGITTSYAYDALSRVHSETRNGITQIYTYDPNGNTLKTTKVGTDGTTQIVESQATYDLAGRQITAKDALNYSTTYAYSTDAGGNQVKTTTNPDNSTIVETSYQDGEPYSVGGTGARPSQHAYSTASGQTIDVETRSSDKFNAITVNTVTDMAGRQISTTYNSNTAATVSYSALSGYTPTGAYLGQVVSQTDADGDVTLYDYDSQGRQSVVCRDLDSSGAAGNGAIDYGGNDQITKMTMTYVTDHSQVVQRTETDIYDTVGSSTPIVASVVETTPSGDESWSTSYGRTTHRLTTYGSGSTRTETVTNPDNSSVINHYTGEFLDSTTIKDSTGTTIRSVSYAPDIFHRVHTSTETKNGYTSAATTTTTTYTNADQIYTVAPPVGALTKYAYDWRGNKSLVTLPDLSTTSYTYYPSGDLHTVGGSQTYALTYTYDTQGRMATMITAKGTTTWTYNDPKMGNLSSKTDALGNAETYTYTNAGRVHTYANANNVTATYGYDYAGNQLSVSYGSSDPDNIIYTRDRLGRITTVADAVGSRNLAYTSDSQLQDDTMTSSTLLSGIHVHTGYNTYGNRQTLSADQSGTTFFSQGYNYDNAQRLNNVTNGSLSVNYAYESNQNLLHSTTFVSGGTMVLTSTYNHDKVDNLTSVTNVSNTAGTISGLSYGFDALNHRVVATQSTDGTYWKYDYDSVGEVISGKRYYSSEPMPGYKFTYNYDGIGNRTSSSGGNGQPVTYSTNSRNQYTQRTVPTWLDIVGLTNTNAVVSVNSAPSTRSGNWFYYGVPVKYPSSSSAAYQPVTVAGELANADGAGHAAWLVTSGHLLVPHGPESFQYDNAGNLKQDGLWSYTWSSAGRLSQMSSLTAVPDGAKRKLTFGYDYVGRRVQKVVYQEPLTSTSSVAAFYSLTDANTQGNWQGTYGQDGYYLYGDSSHSYSSAPSYATVSVTGATAGTWSGSTTDPRAILPPGGGTGSAGLLYGGTIFIDVNITDGQSHWVSMYFLDWDISLRQALVYVYDGGSAGTLLDTEPISAFYSGKYLTWGIRGHVKFVIKNLSLNNTNASVSGLFFDSGERKLSDTRYVYDGWNVISELDGKNSNAVKRTEVWGNDLSGSLKDAGGVGGLLAVNESLLANAGTYLPCYDGNGNVVAMENTSDGSIAAQYEYGPFGEAIRGTGVYAANNPWRFSTKYDDSETGLLYYGNRYYQSLQGRWISRDLTEEAGGANLYCMLNNDSICGIDLLGNGKTVEYNKRFDAYLEWFPEQGTGEIKILDNKVEVMRFRYSAERREITQILTHGGSSLRGISVSAMKKIAPQIQESLNLIVKRVGGQWLVSNLADGGAGIVEKGAAGRISAFLGGATVSAILFAMEPTALGDDTLDFWNRPYQVTLNLGDNFWDVFNTEGVIPELAPDVTKEQLNQIKFNAHACHFLLKARAAYHP